MIRIPNPGSDINIFIRIFKELYEELKERDDFNLDDLSHAMVKRNNVSSQGAIGQEALRRSTREDRSRDPIYNQSKMYAELFRTFGWIQSTTSALRFSFSLLGQHVASAQNAKLLVKECLLGLAYPNEVLEVKGGQSIRIFSIILRTMAHLDDMISRDEMIVGPMNINDDRSDKALLRMIALLVKCRKSNKFLNSTISSMEKKNKITKITMGNYTRFPIAALQWVGWAKKRDGYFCLTDSGNEELERLAMFNDIRLTDFRKFPKEVKPALIRIAFYGMLSRSNFNLDPVKEQMERDIKTLRKHEFNFERSLLFSPFQQIIREEVNRAFSENSRDETSGSSNSSCLDTHIESGEYKNISPTTLLFEIGSETATSSKETSVLIREIKETIVACENNIDCTIESLVDRFSESNKDIFYPLVVNLFNLLGFDCRISRHGVNYERADAIIIDSKRSIPIEIKSPGEELEISVKGVRQALENKVILLSRKNYPTDFEATSLVVGFNPPNERSEVHELVEDIKNTFNIKIGVIDFRSLMRPVISSIISGKSVVVQKFFTMKGVIRVSSA